jgi:hypothetical protein
LQGAARLLVGDSTRSEDGDGEQHENHLLDDEGLDEAAGELSGEVGVGVPRPRMVWLVQKLNRYARYSAAAG